MSKLPLLCGAQRKDQKQNLLLARQLRRTETSLLLSNADRSSKCGRRGRIITMPNYVRLAAALAAVVAAPLSALASSQPVLFTDIQFAPMPAVAPLVADGLLTTGQPLVADHWLTLAPAAPVHLTRVAVHVTGPAAMEVRISHAGGAQVSEARAADTGWVVLDNVDTPGVTQLALRLASPARATFVDEVVAWDAQGEGSLAVAVDPPSAVLATSGDHLVEADQATCRAFAFAVPVMPATVGDAALEFDAVGAAGAFTVVSAINGMATRGGLIFPVVHRGQHLRLSFSPALLLQGTNELTLCGPAAGMVAVEVSNLTVMLEGGSAMVRLRSVRAENQQAVFENPGSLLALSPQALSVGACVLQKDGVPQPCQWPGVTSFQSIVLPSQAPMNAVLPSLPTTWGAVPHVLQLDGASLHVGNRQRVAMTGHISGPSPTAVSLIQVMDDVSEHTATFPVSNGHFAFEYRTPANATRITVTPFSPSEALPSLTLELALLRTLTGPAGGAPAGADVAQPARNRSGGGAQGRPGSDAAEETETALFGAEGQPRGQRVTRQRGAEVRAGDRARIVIPPNAMEEDGDVSISRRGSRGMPPFRADMVVVTAPRGGGYRFLPEHHRFRSPATLALPYDPFLIPEGMSPADVRTYYFDEALADWVPLEKVMADPDEEVIVSLTDHFTDMVNAIMVSPESPTADAFSPNAVTSMTAFSPVGAMTLVAPPSVRQDGAVSMSYPFFTPKVRGRYQPSVALSYSAEPGLGTAGEGWSLGSSSVDVDTRFGVPRYRDPGYNLEPASDRYMLDGQALVPGTLESPPPGTCRAGGPATHFMLRREGRFARIVRCGSRPQNYYWEVTDRDGTYHRYGQREDARLKDPSGLSATCEEQDAGNIARWLLEEVADVDGNTTTYTYARVDYASACCRDDTDLGTCAVSPIPQQPWTQRYLKAIAFGPFTLTADYESLPPYPLEICESQPCSAAQVSARTGFKVVSNKRLTRVRVTKGAEVVREYGFGYAGYSSDHFYKTLLEEIRECAQSGCTAGTGEKTSFQYKPAQLSLGAGQPRLFPVDDTAPLSLTVSSNVGFNGGVQASPGGYDRTKTTVAAGLGLSGTVSAANTYAMFMDINGDGYPDHVVKQMYPWDTLPLPIPPSDGRTTVFDGTGYVYPDGAEPLATDPTLTGVDLGSVLTLATDLSVSVGINVSANGGPEIVSASSEVGFNGSVNMAGAFPADVNGDGLVDFVRGFGLPPLVQQRTPSGQLTFVEAPEFLPVEQALPDPPGVQAPETTGITQLLDKLKTLGRDRHPVWRWRAPRTGHITYRASVQVPPGCTPSGAVEALLVPGYPALNAADLPRPAGLDNTWLGPIDGVLNQFADNFFVQQGPPGDPVNHLPWRASAQIDASGALLTGLTSDAQQQSANTFAVAQGGELLVALHGQCEEPGVALNLQVTVDYTHASGCEGCGSECGPPCPNDPECPDGCPSPLATDPTHFDSADDFRSIGKAMPLFVTQGGEVTISGTVTTNANLADETEVRLMKLGCGTELAAILASPVAGRDFPFGGENVVVGPGAAQDIGELFVQKMKEIAAGCNPSVAMVAQWLKLANDQVNLAWTGEVARGDLLFVDIRGRTPIDPAAISISSGPMANGPAVPNIVMVYNQVRPLASPQEPLNDALGPLQDPDPALAPLVVPHMVGWRPVAPANGVFKVLKPGRDFDSGHGVYKVRWLSSPSLPLPLPPGVEVFGVLPAGWVNNVHLIIQQDGVWKQSIVLNPPTASLASFIPPPPPPPPPPAQPPPAVTPVSFCNDILGSVAGLQELCNFEDHLPVVVTGDVEIQLDPSIDFTRPIYVSLDLPDTTNMAIQPEFWDVVGFARLFEFWLNQYKVTPWLAEQAYLKLRPWQMDIVQSPGTQQESTRSITDAVNVLVPQGTFGFPLPVPLGSPAGFLTSDGFRGWGYGQFMPLPGSPDLEPQRIPTLPNPSQAAGFMSLVQNPSLGAQPIEKILTDTGDMAADIMGMPRPDPDALKVMLPGAGQTSPGNVVQRLAAIDAMIPTGVIPQVFPMASRYPGVRIVNQGHVVVANEEDKAGYEGMCAEVYIRTTGGTAGRCELPREFGMDIGVPGMPNIQDLRAHAVGALAKPYPALRASAGFGSSRGGTVTAIGAQGTDSFNQPMADFKDMTGDGIPDMIFTVPGVGQWVLRADQVDTGMTYTALWFGGGPQSLSLSGSVGINNGGGQSTMEAVSRRLGDPFGKEGPPIVPNLNGTFGYSSQAIAEVDMNGDGLADEVLGLPSGPCVMVRLNLGVAFAQTPECWTDEGFSQIATSGSPLSPQAAVGVMLTGLATIMPAPLLLSASMDLSMSQRLGAAIQDGSSSSIQPSLGAGLRVQFTHFADVNGDGLADKVFAASSDGLYVQLNTGHGFRMPAYWGAATTWEGDLPELETQLAMEAADYHRVMETGQVDHVTGDKLLVDVPAGQPYVFDLLQGANRGADFMAGMSEHLLNHAASDTSLLATALRDGWTATSSALPRTLTRTISTNFGVSAGLSGGTRIQIGHAGVSISGNMGASGSRNFQWTDSVFQDLNGDGLAEPGRMVKARDAQGVIRSALMVKPNLAVGGNHLMQVTNPLGGRIEIGYTRIPNSYEMPSGKWVLGSVKVYTGRHRQLSESALAQQFPTQAQEEIRYSRFEYLDGFFDRTNKEFRGFGRVRAVEADAYDGTDLRTQCSTYSNRDEWVMAGLPLEQSLVAGGPLNCDAPAERLEVTAYGYHPPKRLVTAPLVAACGRPLPLKADACEAWVVHKAFQTHDTYQWGQHVYRMEQRWVTYDDRGNPTKMLDLQHTALDAADADPWLAKDDLYHQVTYTDPDPAGYVVDLPVEISTESNPPGTLLRHRRAKYDSRGHMISATVLDPSGDLKSTYQYDGSGRLVSVKQPSGYIVSINSYDEEVGLYPTSVTDSLGLGTTASYDVRFGAPLSRTDPNGQTLSMSYDPWGRTTTVVAPGQIKWTLSNTYATDTSGIRYATTLHRRYNTDGTPDKGGHAVVAAVDGFGQPLFTVKELAVGGVTRWVVSGRRWVDSLGRPRLEGQPEPLDELKYAFDLEVPGSAALRSPVRRNLDVRDRTTGVIEQPGPDDGTTPRVTSVVHDTALMTPETFALSSGRRWLREQTVDPRGVVTWSLKDGNGANVATVEQSLGEQWVTGYTYDRLGQLTGIVDAAGSVTQFQYNMRGQKISETLPASGTISYEYDPEGRLTQRTNALGQKVTYGYQPGTSRVTSMTRSGSSTLVFDYGAPGDPGMVTGRLKRVTDEYGTEDRTYDALGNLATQTRTIGAMGGSNKGVAYPLAFKMDPLQRLLSITYPDGEKVAYEHNAQGQVTSIVGWESYATGILYDEFERRIQTTYRGHTESLGYHLPSGLLRTMDNSFIAGTRKGTLHYDPSGNIMHAEATAPAPLPLAFDASYQYDARNRLTNATVTANHKGGPNLSMSHWFTYDSTHRMLLNIQTVTQNGAQNGLTRGVELKYEAGRKPVLAAADVYLSGGSLATRTYEHDAAGQLNHYVNGGVWFSDRWHTWTPEGWLKGVTKAGLKGNTQVDYFYDAQGDRVAKHVNGAWNNSTRIYLGPHAVFSGDGLGTKHMYLGAQRVATVWMGGSKGFSYMKDHLGTTGALVDHNGRVVEHRVVAPYGETLYYSKDIAGTTSQDVNNYVFTEKEEDPETGYSYFGARYYDPFTARWLSPDPDWYKQGPPGLNVYQYAYWNPIKFVDPDGRDVRLQRDTREYFAGHVNVAVVTGKKRSVVDFASWKWIEGSNAKNPPGLREMLFAGDQKGAVSIRSGSKIRLHKQSKTHDVLELKTSAKQDAALLKMAKNLEKEGGDEINWKSKGVGFKEASQDYNLLSNSCVDVSLGLVLDFVGDQASSRDDKDYVSGLKSLVDMKATPYAKYGAVATRQKELQAILDRAQASQKESSEDKK